MQWLKKEQAKNSSKGDEIRIGVASWDDGSRTSMSIKYTWFNSLNRASRGGEVPIEAIEQMRNFAKREGYI